MPQISGTPCAVCKETILAFPDGKACGVCGQVTHMACARPRPGAGCPECGAERLPAPAPESASDAYPVSAVCPKCGGTEYETRRPQAMIAFTSDRVCRACDTRYTPPTPVWASVLFILGGTLLFAIGSVIAFLSAFAGALSGNMPSLIVGMGLGVVGALAIRHGFRAIRNRGKV